MSYSGASVTIPCGMGGLITDEAQNKIPVTNIIEAKNISFVNGVIEKQPGSKKWNPSFPLPAGVVSAIDWWPTDYQQRLIALCSNGRVYKQNNGYSAAVEVTAQTGSPTTLVPDAQAHILVAGQELPTRDKKIIIFSGNDSPQVIVGDGLTRRNITKPAVEWTGTNHPTFGIVHRGRVFVMGQRSQGSLCYASKRDDHEAFTNEPSDTDLAYSFNVFPGEGERLIGGYVYKGRLFVAKYPKGVYYLVDQDSDPDNWYFAKLNENFGIASAHSMIEAKDDVLMASSSGSINVASAAFQLGDIKASDLLSNLRNERYMRENTNQGSYPYRWSVYHEDTKIAYFTYRSPTGVQNDRMLVIDLSHEAPKVMWSTKDQANCLFLQKDIYGVRRPVYGANDGHIYRMEQPDRDVGGSTAYEAKFQTPHMNLGDPSEKLFEFLELEFEPSGNWNVTAKIIIDGVPTETITFPVYYGAVLDRFILDKDRLEGRVPRSIRKPIHGKGRNISIEISNSGLRENFSISAMTVYYRKAGQAQRDPSK